MLPNGFKAKLGRPWCSVSLSKPSFSREWFRWSRRSRYWTYCRKPWETSRSTSLHFWECWGIPSKFDSESCVVISVTTGGSMSQNNIITIWYEVGCQTSKLQSKLERSGSVFIVSNFYLSCTLWLWNCSLPFLSSWSYFLPRVLRLATSFWRLWPMTASRRCGDVWKTLWRHSKPTVAASGWGRCVLDGEQQRWSQRLSATFGETSSLLWVLMLLGW